MFLISVLLIVKHVMKNVIILKRQSVLCLEKISYCHLKYVPLLYTQGIKKNGSIINFASPYFQ